jgi:hypothetical protein
MQNLLLFLRLNTSPEIHTDSMLFTKSRIKKPTGQRTGLGLSLAYDMVKAHGGEIRVVTKINSGTIFTIELPITKTNKMKQLIFILLLIPTILKAQETKPENLSKALERSGFATLATDWKYKAGDNPEWANPNFDDSSWEMFNNNNLYNQDIQKKTKKTNIVWYRKRIIRNSTTTQKLVLNVFQSGASEIYLDGELIHSLGKVSTNPDSVVRYNPVNCPARFSNGNK